MVSTSTTRGPGANPALTTTSKPVPCGNSRTQSKVMAASDVVGCRANSLNPRTFVNPEQATGQSKPLNGDCTIVTNGNNLIKVQAGGE